ncbi:sirohydrochlorin ferrochelatase [Thalassobacillus cyri]|uniref:Sirohydrochlorin ferrochelatase n=1 Tax=Thalassobacillus cyri TaxID=571932 RepID=A0A1H4HJC2_9BACI|nr:sirohydrochlorin chelatase [Thalassobacillus cyri]SEB21128.1 sirohydrochlorin ferrochelatase [Thalassobacillus cyri]
MLGILYVSHGSRIPEARRQAVDCIHSVQLKVGIGLQEICYLELAQPDMAEGIRLLVEKGADKIAVIPVLLLRAGHYYTDIPKKIETARKAYPSIEFQYGKPLGVQDRLIDILIERIQETHGPIHPDTNILLVGRGSRNPETPAALQKIQEKLRQRLDGMNVDTCYLAACQPSFEQGLEESIQTGYRHTIVVPYLWFTGILIQSMQKKVREYQQDGHHVILCNHLGNHPKMVEALAERVYEIIPGRKLKVYNRAE